MSTETTTTSAEPPAYLKPYLEDVTQQAQQQYQSAAYEPYGAQRFAELDPLQQQAINNLQQFTPASQIGQGTNLANQAGLGSLNAGQQYGQQATSPGALQSWMSPYMQGVVQQQKQGAIQDYARQLPQLGASAVQVGGLGGTRHALMQAEGQRNLQNQLGGIEAQGLQSAYDSAIKNMQFGANIGMQGYGQAMQGANTLGTLGQTGYGQAMGINQAQQQAGAGLQGQAQAGLESQYQDFLARQQYPQQQLSQYSNIIRGLPSTSSSTSSTQIPAGSTWAQAIGLLGGIGSLLGGRSR
tara:strand:+ start:1092 stop:1982 length:891 start_codon:yes stop_codon:yes gene_type:complete